MPQILNFELLQRFRAENVEEAAINHRRDAGVYWRLEVKRVLGGGGADGESTSGPSGVK